MAIDTQYGFSAKQVIDHVENYVGNCSDEFTTYVTNLLNMAQFRYASMHDWAFLFKSGIDLNIVNGTTQYELNVASVGYNISADDVKSIYLPDPGKILRKTEVQLFRRIDPEVDDGGANDDPSHWAPVGDQRIEIYPPQFKNATLKIDAKILPTPVTDFTSEDPSADPAARLAIPYKYQESFIELVLAMVLDRENDDRATSKFQEARLKIREDIADDMSRLADTVDARLRHYREAGQEGNIHSLNSIAFATCDDDEW